MGSGFRTFTAGEVLTASNVQNYLMDQSVMVFGGSAARSSAIGTANFEEGMVSYLTDTDKVEAYNGTNWVSVAPTTSQGLTLINTTSFSAVSSISVNDVFSATYDNYRVDVILTGASTNTADTLRLRVAGADNSTSNYNYAGFFVRATAATIPYGNTNQTSFGDILAHNNSGNEAFTLNFYSPFAAERTKFNAAGFDHDGTSLLSHFQAGLFAATTSFTGFTLISGSGTFTGRIRVYGLAN